MNDVSKLEAEIPLEEVIAQIRKIEIEWVVLRGLISAKARGVPNIDIPVNDSLRILEKTVGAVLGKKLVCGDFGNLVKKIEQL